MKGRLVMEDKKDFDKDKQEMGTQQMPHVPTEGDEDGKKGIIVLFGHEFDKRKAVMAGLGGLLAIASSEAVSGTRLRKSRSRRSLRPSSRLRSRSSRSSSSVPRRTAG